MIFFLLKYYAGNNGLFVLWQDYRSRSCVHNCVIIARPRVPTFEKHGRHKAIQLTNEKIQGKQWTKLSLPTMQKATSVFPQPLAKFSFLVRFPTSNNYCQFWPLKWLIILTINILKRNENSDLDLKHLYAIIIITKSLNMKEGLRHRAVYSWGSKTSAPAWHLWGRSKIQKPDHVIPMEDTCITKLLYKPGQKYYSKNGDTFLEVFLPGNITTRAFWVHSSSGCANFQLVYSCAAILQLIEQM